MPQSHTAASQMSDWEGTELLVYLVDEEKDIYIGVFDLAA
jgi:hypothetical protein